MAEHTPKPLEERAVVSCFIFRDNPDASASGGKQQVALFRRSGKVHTYQHKLGPIAGSIEKDDPSPLAAAWRELHEETTLTQSNLRLILKGKPFSFGDENVGRRWTVNPFGFRLVSLADEARIKIDWEHEGWGWYDPLSVRDDDDFGGVARLMQSLRAVCPAIDLGEEAADILMHGLTELQNDHESGARVLATNAMQLWRDVVAAVDDSSQEEWEWQRKARIAAWHVWKNGRESMGAAVLNTLLNQLEFAETARHVKQGNVKGGLKEEVIARVDYRIKQRKADNAQGIAAYLSRFIYDEVADTQISETPLKILTLSESSSITEALRYLIRNSRALLDIRILESRPLFEGASLAGKLAQTIHDSGPLQDAAGNEVHNGRRVTVWTDASAALAAKDIHLVIIGADRISADGDVSNKTGSLPAILCAKHVSPTVRVVVVSESEKIAPPEQLDAHVVENNDPQQVSRAWQPKYNSASVQSAASMVRSQEGDDAGGEQHGVVEVRNIFFEWVPSELIDNWITEKGAWTKRDIARHAEELEKQVKRFFEDL